MLFKGSCGIFPVGKTPRYKSIISLWRMCYITCFHTVKAEGRICCFIVMQPRKPWNHSCENDRAGWLVPKFLFGKLKLDGWFLLVSEKEKSLWCWMLAETDVLWLALGLAFSTTCWFTLLIEEQEAVASTSVIFSLNGLMWLTTNLVAQ